MLEGRESPSRADDIQTRRRPGRLNGVAPALIPLLRGHFVAENKAKAAQGTALTLLLTSAGICSAIGAILYIAVRYWGKP
jgi:hypothetical protein